LEGVKVVPKISVDDVVFVIFVVVEEFERMVVVVAVVE
jgi:hypothetical protein